MTKWSSLKNETWILGKGSNTWKGTHEISKNRVIGVDEEEGEDCMALVLNILTLLGFEDA